MSQILMNHWYTQAEIDAIIKDSPELANVQMRGYYLETDGQRFRFIHDSKTVQKDRSGRVDTTNVDWGDIPPIVKRTAQQRTDSLVDTILADCLQAGCVPGFSNEKMTELLGYKWVTGVSIMSDAVARRIAGIFLGLAERKRSVDEHRLVVKPGTDDITRS